MEGDIEEGAPQLPPTRARHIKKRSLKNKGLHVSFNEKDLRDYVTGFHKRKKKRRKEAYKQQEEALRLKRLEQRKKRKLERELALYGGAASTATDAVLEENDEYNMDDEERAPIESINGTTMYDNGDIKVTVTTSEISREDENENGPRENVPAAIRRLTGVDKKHNLSVMKKKSFKKIAKHQSRPKLQNNRDRKKGKKKNKKR